MSHLSFAGNFSPFRDIDYLLADAANHILEEECY
jgi:hypothetical protein